MAEDKNRPYDGVQLEQCEDCNFRQAAVVVVSGAIWNPCGHALLRVGDKYFHIAEVKGRPKYMDAKGYARYLQENGKKEIRSVSIPLPYPQKAKAKLNELIKKPWTWFILPNNCATFVEAILQAGGSKGGWISNCPRLENFITPDAAKEKRLLPDTIPPAATRQLPAELHGFLV